ncbi:LPXTG-motif cell wall anchor domain-containing protein, partial [Streptococcus equinus]
SISADVVDVSQGNLGEPYDTSDHKPATIVKDGMKVVIPGYNDEKLPKTSSASHNTVITGLLSILVAIGLAGKGKRYKK